MYSCNDLVKRLINDYHEENLTTLSEAESFWRLNLGFVLPDVDKRNSQKSWEEPQNAAKYNTLLDTANSLEDKPRLLATANPEASAWLKCVPSSHLGTLLNNKIFHIACALRLGCKICEKHICICGSMVSELGLHGLACRKSAGRRARHNEVNDIIARALQSAEIPCVKEPMGISRSDGKRPDGATLIPWKQGQTLLWDATVVDTYAASYIGQTSKTVGSAARMGEQKKLVKYQSLLNQYCFVPLAIETSGVYGKDGLRFVREIGNRITANSGEQRATSFLIQRISIAIQRGNGISVMGTMPNGQNLHELDYVN